MSNANFADPMRTALATAVKILLAVCLLIPGATSAGAAAPAAGPGGAQIRQQPAPGYLVMENVGQYPGEARFLLKQGDRRIWLTGDALWLTVPDPVAADEQVAQAGHRRQPDTGARSGTAIRFTFPRANPAPTLEPFGRVSTHVSYLIGSDPAAWHTDIPVWSGVRYRDLYPGVDLVIGDTASGAAAGAMPWRLEARRGADLGAVTLRAEGSETVTAAAGQLRLELKGRAVNLALPTWSVAGRADPLESAILRQAPNGEFVVSPQQGSQAEKAAVTDASQALDYSETLGGTAYDTAYAIAIDGLGNAYITGETESFNLPTSAGAYDLSNSGFPDEPKEAFVAKLNAAGSDFLYVTYLGGEGPDAGRGIAVDNGLAYVVGDTNSVNFPGAQKPTLDGSDIFVAALNANGTGVRYVSRLGGNGTDIGYGIALDYNSVLKQTNAYVTGSSSSASLALAGSCATGGDTNLVVAKLNGSGTTEYTTCLGDGANETGNAIAVRGGEAHVTGDKVSTDNLLSDILVARFNANGTLAASAVIGGAAYDWSNGIAVDGSGNVYIAATTSALDEPPVTPSDFPVTLGTPAYGGGYSDAVIMKLPPALTPIEFATFLGGNDEDYAHAIAIDTVQGLYVGGATRSTNFPVTTGAIQGGEFDAFVARMHMSSGAQNKVTYATYLGFVNDDWAWGVATDTGENAFITGSTALDGGYVAVNALVAQLKVSNPPAAPVVTITRNGTNAKLDWLNTPPQPRFQVFRSDRPYFLPGDLSSVLVKDDTANTYLDNNALNTVDAQFYVVKAVSAAPEASANSNRVGKFTFQLTPGLN